MNSGIFNVPLKIPLLIIIQLLTVWSLSTPAHAEPAPDKIFPKTGIEFVKIQGGCFKMGSALKKKFEQPVHEVCVADFYIGRFEVTQECS